MKDKRQQIMEATLQLFAEKGYEGASIRDIAEKACVNVAMVNYYFGSKEKLFEQIVELKSSTTRLQLDEIAGNESLASIEKVEMVIDAYIERLFMHRLFHRLIHQELILNQREALQCSIVNNLSPNAIIIKHVIETGIKKGEFKKVDIELTIATLIGTINQVLLSKKMCNRLMNKPDDYVPYEDARFKKRVSDHLKQLMHAHLLNK
ncbi:TetR/AcrR family transcriptional regulator [Parafilimonas sp.]|uniref:TetR/AcrR family transcriptional regulator n=1 Tax=Parafilimonas sp. TaxID=1969739 RepID=UPI0039E52AFF